MNTGNPLAQPLRIGHFTVRNRIMQAAHSKQYSDRVESERETAYYVRRAQGGCALFVAGNHFVHPSGSIRNFQDAYLTESVEANRRMTDAVHRAGARILVQLNHHGAQAQQDGPFGPRAVYAPSRFISPSTGLATREASHRDIAEFVQGWAESARLAKLGGFDGVEIHMAHSYLLHQFLSPIYNKRTDSYGGDLEGRTRFPREVIAAVRKAVGEDFTVGIRIVANDFDERGLSGDDARRIIERLREDHRIDFLNLAAGGYHNVHYVFPPSAMPTAWMQEEVRAIKEANPDVPVFGVGALERVEDAAELITSGVADMVALTRGQIADPDLANKLLGGREDDIQHCIRLNQGCLGRGSRGLPVSCTVNPHAGHEHDDPTPPVSAPRHCLVVGGGPAGMRAALDLDKRGHSVVLVERNDQLGGQARLASKVPGRESIRLLLDDLTRDLDRSDVEVRLGYDIHDLTEHDVEFDEIIIATGATSDVRSLATESNAWANLAPASCAVSVEQALANPAGLGAHVAIVDGDGSAYAAGVLRILAEAVEQLDIITPFETLIPQIGPGYDRPITLSQLFAGQTVRRYVSSTVRVTESGQLEIRDSVTGAVQLLDGLDAIVALEPRVPVTLQEIPEGVILIGDALAPRNLDAAISDGATAASLTQPH